LLKDYPTVARYLFSSFRGRLALGEVLWALGRWAAAAEQFRDAAALGEKLKASDASAQNALAWFLATCPDLSFRDPSRAVAIAKELVARPEATAMGHARRGLLRGGRLCGHALAA
jgi:hypothetical protein